MKKAIMILCSILGFAACGQENKNVNIDYMLRGKIYAQTSIHDSTSLGGFGRSKNLAKKAERKFLDKNCLLLEIDTTELITISEEFNGYQFYIANRTDSIIKLNASDSRLYVVAEVYHEKKWQPIEYLSGSSCGNSYHKVLLKPNEFWEFKIPKFTGEIPTKIRYRLKTGKDQFIYSNEVSASFNIGQLSDKIGYKSRGLMDPYND